MSAFSISEIDKRFFISPTEEVTDYFGEVSGSYDIFIGRLFGLGLSDMLAYMSREYGARMMKKPSKTGYFSFQFSSEDEAKKLLVEIERRWDYLVSENIITKGE